MGGHNAAVHQVLAATTVFLLTASVANAFSLVPSHVHSSFSKQTFGVRSSSEPLRVCQQPKLRTGPRTSNGHAVLSLRASSEFDTLKDLTVTSLSSGSSVPIVKKDGVQLIAFLTHFGDLSSWEYAQQLRLQIPDLEEKGVEVVAIGIGGESSAKEFAKNTNFPVKNLYFDPNADCAAALGFEPGFGRNSPLDPQSNGLSPYLRLLPMLLGIGSPGTLGKVIYGYFGDRNFNPKWTVEMLKSTATGSFPYVEPSTFDALGSGYLRPFELATVRLQNMIGILNQWNELIPSNQDLVVQQGGTIVLDGETVLYRFDDKGILVYAPVADAVAAALNA